MVSADVEIPAGGRTGRTGSSGRHEALDGVQMKKAAILLIAIVAFGAFLFLVPVEPTCFPVYRPCTSGYRTCLNHYGSVTYWLFGYGGNTMVYYQGYRISFG